MILHVKERAMLLACPECHHQYDAGDLEPGSKFLCHCGKHVRVPKQRAREVVMAHCSSCGASLDQGKRNCKFCGSDVSATDHQIGEVCPECYRRMLKGAEYCSGCGVRIQTERLLIHPDQAIDCPRCKKSMIKRQVQAGSLWECTKCGGIWLDQEFFEDLVESKDIDSIGGMICGETNTKTIEISAKKKVKYIPCPVCSNLMNRNNFALGSGVILDTCRRHGSWFDAFELEQIFDFIRQGGMQKARKREIEESRRESRRAMSSGMFHGSAPNDYEASGFLAGSNSNQGSGGIDFLDIIFGVILQLLKH
jgi:Zn-finger nucleic acid-binding protein